ncbi:hypothetical protein G3I60_00935 [Streptomyces sp. SID13666]|uniref:hypothetical protein n=1 Tax=unclassified Streptomyces TaxID=2593676 RepID=UPI0013C14281|nr:MULTISPECIES: hypothetical protein [unclassified Streptomyces]NEA52775.1 hypothetical protein [Streptomyces sp. SID13666]NEA69898.1 hypothetical protein [Streptomyces sp. SID13588]
MSSFATHRRRVHDEGLSARVRHSHLRHCRQNFAPYGFRATYHHLSWSARIPREPERDPGSLVRAVEELHLARQLWLADERAYASRRRHEKARGERRPVDAGSWRGGRSRPGILVHCPDPVRHPTEALPVVVERVLRSSVRRDGDRIPACRVCGTRNGTTAWHDGGYWVHQLCAVCGAGLASTRAP